MIDIQLSMTGQLFTANRQKVASFKNRVSLFLEETTYCRLNSDYARGF